MNTDKTKEFTVRLDSIDYLFIAPEVAPFSEKETELLGESALMRVMKKMEPGFFRRRDKVHLNILLPPEKLTPSLPNQVDAALDRFCEARITDNKLRIRRTIWVGLRSLPFGLIFLGISMALSAMFDSQALTFIPERLNRLLGEGFVVIGWIALWNPVGTFLYDWVPFWRENQVYRYMKTMDINLQPQQRRE